MKTNFSLILIALLTAFALLQPLYAVVPPPDGGYPNFTTAEGQKALQNLTTGAANTALGAYALFGTSTGSFNTAVGAGALDLNTADSNTAVGTAALLLNTTGNGNTATGTAALEFNNSGSSNTANGAFALFSNTEGLGNTAIGANALHNNTQGDNNTAIGDGALFGSTGNFNTAVGSGALLFNQTDFNTAVGDSALLQTTIGFSNTAVGKGALQNNTTGGGNTAVGSLALLSNTVGFDNSALGASALAGLTSGSNNIALGNGAGLGLETGVGNVYIGVNPSATSENFHTYIDNINTTSVSGANTDTVTVNLTTGLMGHLSSSRRHKEQVQSMANSSEVLYRLNPVTYRYKKEIDPSQALDYGLVAEEVADIDPNLTACNREGQIESVRYTAINAMLLNEFLKEHRKNEEQQATIADLKREIARLAARDEEQAAQLQKVSAQFELSQSPPQTVANIQ